LNCKGVFSKKLSLFACPLEKGMAMPFSAQKCILQEQRAEFVDKVLQSTYSVGVSHSCRHMCMAAYAHRNRGNPVKTFCGVESKAVARKPGGGLQKTAKGM